MTNMIKTVAEALRRHRNINNTINELYSLSDAELKDIGVHRANIEKVARGIVDIHRTVRDTNGGG
tara:strand:- start:625 stop:819 length:195 start_codon:yes stop_codon:yes gene_type:complete